MKKILIVYATAGEGHKQAASALKAAFDILNPADCEIKLVDSLNYTKRFFKWFYLKGYIFIVTYLPSVWGLLYFFLDLKWFYPVVRRTRRIINGRNAAAFEQFLSQYQPDVAVATHFLASEVIGEMKRKGKLKTRLIVCVTDFRMHSFWYSNEADAYCVGFFETCEDLTRKWGIPPQKVQVLGIPVHPRFNEEKGRYRLCEKRNLAKDLFTVLITGGGFGVGPIMGLVKVLCSMKKPIQVIVVCGHNEKLKDKIDTLTSIQYPVSASGGSIQIKTFGFVDYVDELMEVSDIGITKAGGLICSEALAKELPLVIIAPIPGQESRNSRLLLKNRAAFKIGRPAQAKKIIEEIYSNVDILKETKENIKRIRKEDPAVNIARFVTNDERNQFIHE